MKFDLKKEQILNHFFHFYFLNSDISLVIEVTIIKFYTDVKNIHTEGIVSHFFILFEKTGNFLCFFKT